MTLFCYDELLQLFKDSELLFVGNTILISCHALTYDEILVISANL